jgi:TP901 family phage tail tape measure protein
MAGGGGVIAALMVTVGANVSGFQQGMGQVQKGIQGAAKAAIVGGAALTAGVTVPLTMLGKEAATAATDFDKQMRNIQSISKQSDESLKGLGATFKTLSTDITQTTDNAASLAAGFYQVQSSGFEGGAAMEVLKASTKAASAGLTDTETAAKGILAVLNAYGMGADQATRVSDVMFKTVDRGIINFEELSGQIGDVISTASTAGVPIEQVGAAIATLTKGGLSGAEAVTALNQVMLTFIAPSKDEIKTAKALGIEFNANTLATKGLGGAMAMVGQVAGGNVETMAKLFGNVRALKGALGLTRGEGAAFAGDLTAMQGAAGATAKAFEIQTKSYDAQAKNFSNTVNVLKIAIGEQLLPIMTGLGQAVLPVVRAFSNLPEPAKKVVVVLGILLAVLGPLLTMAGLAVSGIAALGGVFGVVGGAIAAVIGTIGAPLLIIIGAIAAFALAWKNNWFGIRDVVANVVGWIKNVLSGLGGVLKSVLGKLFGISEADINASVASLGGALKSSVGGIKDTVVGAFKGAGQAAGTSYGKGLADGVKDTAVGEAAFAAAKEKYATAMAKGDLAAAAAAFPDDMDLAGAATDALAESQHQLALKASMGADGLLDVAKAAAAFPDDMDLADAATASLGTTLGTAQPTIAATATSMTALGTGATQSATAMQQLSAGASAMAASTQTAQTAMAGLAASTATSAATMTTTTNTVIVQTEKMYSGMTEGAALTKTSVLSVMQEMGSGVVQTVVGMVASIIGQMQGAVGQAGGAGAAIGSAFAAGIASQVGAVAAAAAQLAAAAAGYLPHSDADRGPLSDVSSTGPAMANSFAAGILSGERDVRRAAQGLADAAAMSGAGVGARPGMGPGAPAPAYRGGAAGNTTTYQQPIHIVIHNPTGRPAEGDIFRQLKYLAALGIIQPVPSGAGAA